ncbi:hypothetical protein [Vibrio phage BONAISHI]|nr:hypothetical protein [Vibrio phage BONAISHI]
MTFKEITIVITTILLTVATILLVGETILSPSLEYYDLASSAVFTYGIYVIAALVFYFGFRGLLQESNFVVYSCRAIIFTSFTIMGYLSWPAILGWFMTSVGILSVHMGVIVSMSVAVVYIALFEKVRQVNMPKQGESS